MQLNIKLVAAIVVVTVGVVAGIYTISTKQVEQPKPGTAGQAPSVQGATQAGKVQVDPNAKFTHFRVGNSNVKSIFIDGKIAWVGTSGGVVRYDTSTDEYRMFNVTNGLLSNGIFHIGKVDNRLAIGTYGGGLSMYDEKLDKWENYNVPDGLADAFVYKTLKISNGDIWIATWSGANRVRSGDLKDRSKWDVYTVENTDGGLLNDWVYSLEEGKDGEMWFATEGGLVRFKDGKWQNWTHERGVGAPYEKVKNDPQFGSDPAKFSEHHAKQKIEMGLQDTGSAFNPNYIVALLVDRDGVVWSGTWGGGLSRFDGKKWSHYTMSDGLPGNHVFMLNEDPSGKLWVGTNNGLASFENGKFKVITTDDGLYSNTVFSMATAADGSLWIGSFGGVTHLAASK
ncbi:MAG: regulator [Gallionellales bacterium RIFCSPHIGHO2_02_FULL_57_16]|nr:MAG: regulator [Gallionellales bacterium RIFCSPHIGHO2_02_FULL_57_16]